MACRGAALRAESRCLSFELSPSSSSVPKFSLVDTGATFNAPKHACPEQREFPELQVT